MSNEPYRSARARLDIDGELKITEHTPLDGKGWQELGKLGSNALPTIGQYIEHMRSEGYEVKGRVPTKTDKPEVDRLTRASKGHLLMFERVSDPSEATSTQRLMGSFEHGPAPEPVVNGAWQHNAEVEAQLTQRTPEQEQQARATAKVANSDLARNLGAGVHRQPAKAPEPPVELSPEDVSRMRIRSEARERFQRNGGGG